MPVVFYCANTSARAVSAALDQLKEGKHVLIVPDRFTLSVEREIFERLGKCATFDIDVLSFSRLAVRILDGGKECLSKEGAVMVLKRVINRNIDRLKHYRLTARKGGFAAELYAAIASFRVMDTTPEALGIAADGMKKGATKDKLEDLALLMEEYEREAGARGTETLLRYEEAIKAAPNSEYLKGRNVTVAAFDFFTGKQLKFLGALMESAPSFRAALTPTNHGANAELYPAGAFFALKEMAEERGIPYLVEESVQQLPPPFDFLNRNLFAYNALTADARGKIVLYAEPTVHDLYQATAREIRRLCDEEGLRYRSIAVLNPFPERSLALADVFTRYRIPVYFDRTRTLAESAAAAFVLRLSECASTHYRRDKTLSLAKNPLWGFSLSEMDAFENAVLRMGIDFDGFLRPFEGEEDAEAERVRARLVSCAERLPKGKVKWKTYIEALGAIRKSLPQAEETAIPDPAFERAAGERLDAVLEEMARLLGDEEGDGAAFRDQFVASANAETVGMLPSVRDSVFVGDLGESRFTELDALFVVNAEAGGFPHDFSYQSVLGAADVEALSAAGVGVYPTPLGQGEEAKARILDLFTKENRLYVGVADAAPSGEKVSPGAVYKELMRMFKLPVRRLNAEFLRDTDSPEGLRRFLCTEENARFELPLLRAGGRGERGKAIAQSVAASLDEWEPQGGSLSLPPVLPRGALLRGNLTKVTQIEAYFRCPYAHLLRYGLGLRTREEGEMRPTDVGTLFHAALERYFRAYIAANGDRDRIPSPEQVAAETVGEERAKFRNPGKLKLYLFDRIEAQCAELLHILSARADISKYRPTLVEASFGMGEGEIEGLKVPLSDRTLTMRGKIDRVDVLNREGERGALVIDYKVGNSDHGELKDVYFGTQIQLYVYLNALKEAGYRPDGAFYLPVRFKASRKGTGGKIRYQGQLRAERDVFEALDPEFAERYAKEGKAQSEVLDFYAEREKDGTLKKMTKGILIGDEGMEAMLRYVRELVRQAAEEIAEGYAKRSPLDGVCQYCDYAPLCGGAEEVRRGAGADIPEEFFSGSAEE